MAKIARAVLKPGVVGVGIGVGFSRGAAADSSIDLPSAILPFSVKDHSQ